MFFTYIVMITVEKVDFHATGKSIYLACCHSLDVVPASYFIRHINDSRLEMAHHGIGVLGAKAMAIPLVVSTHVINVIMQVKVSLVLTGAYMELTMEPF